MLNKKILIYLSLILIGFFSGFFTHILITPVLELNTDIYELLGTSRNEIPNFNKIYPSSQEGVPQEWKTYTNSRFGFTINYPVDWIEGKEADNGDGKALHKDNGNEILVYGTLNPSTFSTQDAPVERETFFLSNGRETTKLRLKDEEGQIRYIVFFEENGTQYVFFANVLENFFRENEQLLQESAKSIKLQ